jgi:hypothetical protein
MAVVARPDVLGSIVAYLRSFPEITALVATAAGATDSRTTPRVSGEKQDWWDMPTHAVWLNRTGGPIVGSDYLLGWWNQRIDVTCYGSSKREATRLMELVLPALCPMQGERAGSFVWSGVRVSDIVPESDIISEIEDDTGWPFAWLPVIVRFCAR